MFASGLPCIVRCRPGSSFHVVCALVVLAVSAVAQTTPPRGRWGPGSVFPPDEHPQFFPADVFDIHHSLDARAYSWYLRSMQEEPLSTPAAREPGTYRVLVLPAYGSPVVIRLNVDSRGTAKLYVKVGKSDSAPEAIVVNEARNVSRGDVETLARLLDDANFWRTPSVQADPRHHTFGGTSWLFEGSRDGVYHLTSWVEPKRVPCSDAASFLVRTLGRVDLRRLPTQPPTR